MWADKNNKYPQHEYCEISKQNIWKMFSDHLNSSNYWHNVKMAPFFLVKIKPLKVGECFKYFKLLPKTIFH